MVILFLDTAGIHRTKPKRNQDSTWAAHVLESGVGCCHLHKKAYKKSAFNEDQANMTLRL